MNNLAQYLDSTNLSSQATRKQIKQLVDDAIQYKFAGLCIAPCWVNYVQNRLKSAGVSDIQVVTVPNWKLGGGLLQMSGIAEECCDTCDEIDYIWNAYEFGDLKVWDKTKEELGIVRKFTKGKLKIIIEAYYLRIADEKLHQQGMKTVIKNACALVNKSGADWIKTDSGLFKRPDFETLAQDCKLMVKYSKIPVKAAGGVRTKHEAQTLVDIGVKRIGTSNAVAIVTSDI